MTRLTRILIPGLTAALAAFPAPAAEPAAEPTAEEVRFFETEVRPVLAESCFKCHGPDKQKSSLRLDSLAAARAGGEGGPAVVPGKPAESLLVEAINHDGLEMPPDRKLPDEQVAALTKWIEIGAPWPGSRDEPPVARRPKITDEDQSWWAFQPVERPPVPDVGDDRWARNEIDHFVLRRLKTAGLAPSPAAERRVLACRLYFDLTGLPPTPDEVEAFVQDESPQAYERLVDRLLESPRYGERWARHWLDLVRFAESDGFKQDAFRPHAWRYRDYVIRAFNDDKPYDRFVMEQLAGDEIAPNDPDALAATAFLRHWIYEYNQRDVRTQWSNILNDLTDVTGDVFLGMGMGCARCHDHKFDPILRRDYYRLQAFFTPLLPRDDLPTATSAAELVAYRGKLTAWEQATADIRRQIEAIERPHRERVARPAIEKFPRDVRPMLRKPADERAPFENQLADLAYRQVRDQYDKLDMQKKLKADEKQRWESLQAELKSYDHLKPKPLPPAFTVTDVGPVAPPTIIPGDRRAEQILPGFLTVLDPGDAAIEKPPSAVGSTGRRTALARWIASPDNPLSTRVIVNRVWQYHFGRAIAGTSSDLGHLGELPTHPDLLDWLASEFVDNGWRFKHLHRLIVTSATYRQASTTLPSEKARLTDPDNRYLWRMNSRRLDAEQIRDAMLAVSGELDLKAGGPSSDHSSKRRTIYNKVIRNRRDPLLDVFDAPDNFNSTSQRNVTTTPTQSLLMINGPWTLARAQAFAARLKKEADRMDPIIDRAFQLVYGRRAEPAERAAALAFLTTDANSFDAPARAKPQLTGPIPALQGSAAVFESKQIPRRLQAADSDTFPSGDFTIEAVIYLESLYADATVRTIAAQWDGNTSHPGWSLGVTSEKSRYQPRNLILQLVGDPNKGGAGYEVIASNLRPKLKRPYYVAVSVRLSDTKPSGIAFYMKDLSQSAAPLQTASAAHKVTSDYRAHVPLAIGGRAGTDRHFWHGLIDNVRLSSAALAKEQLLIGAAPDDKHTAGFWQFEGTPGALKDASPSGNLLVTVDGQENSNAAPAALIDFCHVLLNSSEFLYVD